MDVVLAETAGFCMGVDLALTRLDELIANANGRPIYILGPIIHNPQVLKQYAEKGVVMVDTPRKYRVAHMLLFVPMASPGKSRKDSSLAMYTSRTPHVLGLKSAIAYSASYRQGFSPVVVW